MGDKGWKQFERRCARDMGVERIPVTGERHGADARTELFAFQFKKRAMIPVWLFSWLDPIVRIARLSERIGVLVLKRPKMLDADALVIMRWGDFASLHGKGGTYGEEAISAGVGKELSFTREAFEEIGAALRKEPASTTVAAHSRRPRA